MISVQTVSIAAPFYVLQMFIDVQSVFVPFATSVEPEISSLVPNVLTVPCTFLALDCMKPLTVLVSPGNIHSRNSNFVTKL